MAMKNNVRDREFNKFEETSDGETSVRVSLADSGLVAGKDFDTVDVTYPTATQEVYTYTLSTVTVQTVTVDYTDSTKCDVLKVTYAV